jgi:Ca2+-transporting ATPase
MVPNISIATDPPSAYILERKPDPKSAPLITLTMWKMIVGQAIYQLAVTLVLHFDGQSLFLRWDSRDMQTEVFNTFVFMQIFNQYNCRRTDNRLNIMEGILSNKWFIGIQVIIIGGQIMIIFLGGRAFSVRCLDQPSQWAVSVLLGALTVPIGVMIRLIPDNVILKVIRYIWPAKGPERNVSGKSSYYGWDLALEGIRDQPAFMNKVRGGRLRHIIHKHPQVFFQSHGSSQLPYAFTLPTAIEDTATSGHDMDGYSKSPPASERTPLICGNGTRQSPSQV